MASRSFFCQLSICRTKKGTALIAVPFEGTYSFFSESFEGVQGGLFQKSPLRLLTKLTYKITVSKINKADQSQASLV